MKVISTFVLLTTGMLAQLWGDSPPLSKVDSGFLYSDLKAGDSRETILQKLRKSNFLQLYEEKDKELIKCAVRWDGFRYELICRLSDNQLKLCLIEGQKGWHPSFLEEVVHPQWRVLRARLAKAFGKQRHKKKFPRSEQISSDELAGYVTDSWDLKDRLLVLAVRSFVTKDCCTDEMIEYFCCTLLIQPKTMTAH